MTPKIFSFPHLSILKPYLYFKAALLRVNLLSGTAASLCASDCKLHCLHQQWWITHSVLVFKLIAGSGKYILLNCFYYLLLLHCRGFGFCITCFSPSGYSFHPFVSLLPVERNVLNVHIKTWTCLNWACLDLVGTGEREFTQWRNV